MYIYIKKNISFANYSIVEGYYRLDDRFRSHNLDEAIQLIKCNDKGEDISIKNKYGTGDMSDVTYVKKHVIDYLCSEHSRLTVLLPNTFRKVHSNELEIKPDLKAGILYASQSDRKIINVVEIYNGNILPHIEKLNHIYFFKPLLIGNVIYLHPVRLSRSSFTCGIVYMTKVNETFNYFPDTDNTTALKTINLIKKSFYDNLLVQIMKSAKISCLLFSTNVESFKEVGFQRNYKASFSEDLSATENYSFNPNSGNRIVTICVNKC